MAISKLQPADGVILVEDGLPVGLDFLAFYTAGRLFNEERESLYDLSYQYSFRNEHVLPPEAHERILPFPFVYPPIVAALAGLVPRLPYRDALYVWLLMGAVATLIILVSVIRASGAAKFIPAPVLLILCVGFPPSFSTCFSMGRSRGGA
jgi:hypothetical protein